MDSRLHGLVRERARHCCEYCGLPEETALPARFHVEHVIAKQHRGHDGPNNRALACSRCNLKKGPNLAGIDPKTRKVVLLLNPRRHKWSRHFRWEGPVLIGRTAIGRATIEVLDMNEPKRIKLREELIDEGVFPPLGFR